MHAALFISSDRVILEDRSRNGILVNGQRVPQRSVLNPGDVVIVGSQQVKLIANEPSKRRVENMTLPKMEASPSVDPLHRTSSPFQRPIESNRLPAFDAGSGEFRAPPRPETGESELELSMVRRAESFALLGNVVEKALAMGRTLEAERMLASPLADVIEASRSGRRVTPSLVDMAAKYSARLATATGKGAWADYVIELYAFQRRPCPAPVIDELYNAFRKVSAVDIGRLRKYIEEMHSRLQTFSAADRFLIQRIEGLERLAALKA